MEKIGKIWTKPKRLFKALRAAFSSKNRNAGNLPVVTSQASPGYSEPQPVSTAPIVMPPSQEQVAESHRFAQPVARSIALPSPAGNGAKLPTSTTEVSTKTEPDNGTASENRNTDPASAAVPFQPKSLWQQALEIFQSPEHAEDYECLRNILPDDSDPRWKSLSDLDSPELLKAKDGTSQHAVVQRLKRYLPSLVAVKGLATFLAKLDPHQVAPYVVTGVFFVIEFSLNSIPENLKGDALDILAENAAIISKWTSFELNTLRRLQSDGNLDVQVDVQKLEELIPEIYVMTLKLQARLQRAFDGSKRRLGVAFVSQELEAWKADLSSLKRQDKKCSTIKDHVKEKLESLSEGFKVLTWLKESNDPEPTLETMISRTGLDQEMYENAGQWFIDWLYEHQTLRDWPEKKDGHRVFWLRGTMGTGKTSLMCQAITKLRKEGLSGPTGSFRVIHYFCYASGTSSTAIRPGEMTIIRALCRKLAWLPSDQVAPEATKFYGDHASENLTDPTPSDWQEVLRKLLQQSPQPVIFVVDALDECGGAGQKEASGFLNTIAKIIRPLPNVLLLCSARHGINVEHYFRDQVSSVNAAQGGKSDDMKNFIEGSITTAHKRLSLTENDGIFFGNNDNALLQNLKSALMQGSNGMFRWVEIWLSIIFPPSVSKQIVDKRFAEKLLKEIRNGERYNSTSSDEDGHKQLDDAYERLWKANHNEQFRDVRIRAFQLVLATFGELTLTQLTTALKINPKASGLYDKGLKSEYVENLYHNFLATNSKGTIVFVHKSAKDFLVERFPTALGKNCFSDTENHLVMSQVILQALEDINHQVWAEARLDLLRCRELFLDATFFKSSSIRSLVWFYRSLPQLQDNRREMQHLSEPLAKNGSFVQYIAVNWMDHVTHLRTEAVKFSSALSRVISMITAQNSALTVVSTTAIIAQMVHDKIILKSAETGWEQRYLDMLGLENDRAVFLLPFLLVVADNSELTSQVRGQLNDGPQTTATENMAAFSPYGNNGSCLRNCSGETALHVACRRNNMEAIELFLNFEKIRVQSGESPVLLWERDSTGTTPIQAALKSSAPFDQTTLQVLTKLLDFEFNACKTISDSAKAVGDDTKQADRQMKQLSIEDGQGFTLWDLASVYMEPDAIRIMLKYEAAWAKLQSPFESEFSSRRGRYDGYTSFEEHELGFHDFDPADRTSPFERMVKRLGSRNVKVTKVEEFVFWFLDNYAIYGSPHLELVLASHKKLMEYFPGDDGESDELKANFPLDLRSRRITSQNLRQLINKRREAQTLLTYSDRFWERMQLLPRRSTRSWEEQLLS